MMKPVVVDAMGGDRAPAEVVRGAIRAVGEVEGLGVDLVGSEDRILQELDSAGWQGEGISVIAATEEIGMVESPVDAVRAKKDSSVGVGLKRVRDGESSAFVSA